jgi:thiol-disulfide isomerase/thioredoxin
MKLLFFPLFLFLLMTGKSQTTGDRENNLLLKVSKKLNSLNSFRYDLKRELNYPSENYQVESQWSEYFEFQNNDTLNFKFQIQDESMTQIFNGVESFDLDKKTKSIQITDRPNQESFQSISALYNSILTLKNILPTIINDKKSIKTLSDTTVVDKQYYLITINVGKRRINNLGNGFSQNMEVDFIYKIVIDKLNNLPLAIIQPVGQGGFIKTLFLNINTNPEPASENSWYYSTYLNEYKQATKKKATQLIPIGSNALNWTLPFYDKNESITLSKLNGKVILLEFWIKNCGPCIKSVPHLNSLKETFKNRNVEILGINPYDSRNDIEWFANRHKINYTVLINGKDLAEKYGVTAYPTCILVDKKGIVLYSGGFDKAKIEELIEKAL